MLNITKVFNSELFHFNFFIFQILSLFIVFMQKKWTNDDILLFHRNTVFLGVLGCSDLTPAANVEPHRKKQKKKTKKVFE